MKFRAYVKCFTKCLISVYVSTERFLNVMSQLLFIVTSQSTHKLSQTRQKNLKRLKLRENPIPVDHVYTA